jgi:hypothetical protein
LLQIRREGHLNNKKKSASAKRYRKNLCLFLILSREKIGNIYQLLSFVEDCRRCVKAAFKAI